MSHSVSQHLRLEIDEYDSMIRRFIPGYEAMLERAVDEVIAAGRLDRVCDLGTGTGALSERLLERHAGCTLEAWDVDHEMLSRCHQRLARFGERVVIRHASFFELDGNADAVMASLSLHHVRELDRKGELYRRIATVLRPGGRFVNADVTISQDPESSEREYRAWTDHQVAHGFTEEEARRHFEEWSEEDRYFALDQELAAVASAGLEARCAWQQIPATVVSGRRRID